MPGAGGQDRDITGGDLDGVAAVAAKQHQRVSARYAERLMDRRVTGHVPLGISKVRQVVVACASRRSLQCVLRR
jgi:hypothetical protein